MDQFDELSKALANGLSRREALRRLGGGLLGAALAALGLDEAKAAPIPCAEACSQHFPPGPVWAACRREACQKCNGEITRVCFGQTNAICCAPGSSCCVH